MNFYTSIGLVGSGRASAGCGILVRIKGGNYLTTCDHILNELIDPNPWFQFGLKKTRFPSAGFFRLPFDIVQRIPLGDTAILQTFNIEDGKYLNFEPISLAPGDQVTAFGYPVNETIKALSEERDEPLLPIRMPGIFLGYENHVILGSKSEKPAIQVNNVGIIKMQGSDFAGYSGGLIADHQDRPLGMIVGESAGHLMFVPAFDL